MIKRSMLDDASSSIYNVQELDHIWGYMGIKGFHLKHAN